MYTKDMTFLLLNNRYSSSNKKTICKVQQRIKNTQWELSLTWITKELEIEVCIGFLIIKPFIILFFPEHFTFHWPHQNVCFGHYLLLTEFLCLASKYQPFMEFFSTKEHSGKMEKGARATTQLFQKTSREIYNFFFSAAAVKTIVQLSTTFCQTI